MFVQICTPHLRKRSDAPDYMEDSVSRTSVMRLLPHHRLYRPAQRRCKLQPRSSSYLTSCVLMLFGYWPIRHLSDVYQMSAISNARSEGMYFRQPHSKQLIIPACLTFDDQFAFRPTGVKMLRRPFIFWVYSCKIWLLTLIDSPICT